jgi:abequosyltransferase
MIPYGLKVKYLSGSYLKNRSGNDSFMDRGIVNRIRISIEGFGNLANIFFGKDSTEAWHIRRVLKNEYTLRYIMYAKLIVKDLHRDDILRLDELVEIIYQDGSLRDQAEHFLYRVVTPSRLTSLQGAVRSLRSFLR